MYFCKSYLFKNLRFFSYIFSFLFIAINSIGYVHAEIKEAKRLDPTIHSERGYTVRYSVFNSQFIKEDVARAYKLFRGKNGVLVNVVLTKTGKETESLGLPAAKVTGFAKNLMQQQKTLEFKTINEGKATYFLAPLRITNEEMFHFEINVTPPDGSRPIKVKFSKKLYVDP